MGKHGYPDWGSEGGPTTTIFSIQDIGELAARLGSIDTFDRRGNVLFLDDFDGGIEGWFKTYNGTGAVISWSAASRRSGGFCAKLQTAASINKYAGIGRWMAYPVLSNLGLEGSVAYEQYWKELLLYLDIDDGTDVHYARVKYSSVENKLYYYDDNEEWVDMGVTVELDGYQPLYCFYKLVVDAVNHKYKRLIVNNQTIDLSGIPLFKRVSVDVPHLNVEIYVSTRLDGAAIAYVDDVIVTQNEP